MGVDLTDPEWLTAVRAAPSAHQLLFYEDGTVRFRHRCDRGERGIITCAPAIQVGPHGNGHTIVQRDPVTVRPSILCSDCGTHGFVTDGRWVE